MVRRKETNMVPRVSLAGMMNEMRLTLRMMPAANSTSDRNSGSGIQLGSQPAAIYQVVHVVT